MKNIETDKVSSIMQGTCQFKPQGPQTSSGEDNLLNKGRASAQGEILSG